MKWRLLLLSCVMPVAAAAFAAPANDAAPTAPSARGLCVVVASDAPPQIAAAAKSIAAAINQMPLGKILCGDKSVQLVTSTPELLSDPKQFNTLAYNNLVLVGLPTDPIVQTAWERDARAIGDDQHPGLYVFGFGNLLGNIGLIESDRNPFLHSQRVKMAPYEAETITITGDTPAAVALAADAFIHKGLLNAVVAPQFTRGDTTILDRDPSLPPTIFPQQLGDWTLAGITQAGEDEYRGVLEDADIEPQIIVRAKYYKAGLWDGAGMDNSEAEYHAGLHRASYGDSLWAAKFESESHAAAVAPKIAGAAHLHRVKNHYEGKQPPFAWGKGTDTSSGPLALWQKGEWVFMSTLPEGTTATAMAPDDGSR